MDDKTAQAIENAVRGKIRRFSAICDGHSADPKYRVETDNGTYYARLIPDDTSMLAYYHLLMNTGKQVPGLVAPDSVTVSGRHALLVTRWIPGTGADLFFRHHSAQEQFLVGTKTGRIIRAMHQATECPDNANVSRCRSMLDNLFSCFPLLEKSDVPHEALHRTRPLAAESSLVHNDLRPANIIVSENGQVSVIDFETMSFRHPWSDLAFCLLFSERYRCYGHGVISGYFDGQLPALFWEAQKILLPIQLMRLIEARGRDNPGIQERIGMVLSFASGESDEMMASFSETVSALT